MKRYIILIFLMVYTALSGDFSKHNLKQHIEILASDSFRGRKPGDIGIELAADYIKKQFKELGLKPLEDSYFQEFKVTSNVKLGQNNVLSVNGKNLSLKKDYIPLSFSANSNSKSEIIFVGYGLDINSDELLWNSYDGLDVRGKWVMMLMGDPDNDKSDSKFFKYSQPRLKVIKAQEKGAIGVLFVLGKTISKEDKLLPLTFDKSVSRAEIPVINITRDVANQIISSTSEKNILEIEKNIDSLKNPITFGVYKTIFASTNVITEKVNTKNVIGLIDVGADDYIVLGAHYDHLGFGGLGSGSRMPSTNAVHNGADDNASGVSGIIELARNFEDVKDKLKSNFVFIAFTAEEMGALGSKYFIKSDMLKPSRIITMINLDMIGRLKDDKSILIGGTGTAEEFDDILNYHQKMTDIQFGMSPEGYGASDHSSFYSENIPVLFFSTGAHKDYHKPNDDIELIDFIGMKNVLDVIFDITYDIQSNYKNLTFKISGPQFRKGGGKYKVTLGFMPDFTSTKKYGVGVGGVMPNSPAKLAGIKKDDRIVSINGKSTKDIYEYMARLNELEPGQAITVEILRNDEKLIFIVQL